MNEQPITATPEATQAIHDAMSGPYRVGNHQQNNLYRGNTYIGAMISAEHAAAAMLALNAPGRVPVPAVPYLLDENAPVIWHDGLCIGLMFTAADARLVAGVLNGGDPVDIDTDAAQVMIDVVSAALPDLTSSSPGMIVAGGGFRFDRRDVATDTVRNLIRAGFELHDTRQKPGPAA